MHPEQIEAVVDSALEKALGNTQTLEELHRVLKKSNVSSLRNGESDALAMNAGLFQSLFLSHARLAQLLGDMANAQQLAHDRIDVLETAVAASQEAVINLQIRLKAYEDSAPPPA